MTIDTLLDQYKVYVQDYISGIKSHELKEAEKGIFQEFSFPIWFPDGSGAYLYIGIDKDKITIFDDGQIYFDVSCNIYSASKKYKVKSNIKKILDKTYLINMDDDNNIYTEIPLDEAHTFPRRLQNFLYAVYSIRLVLG